MAGFVSVLAAEPAVYGFGDAVLAGWAADGGMLWPNKVPKLSRRQIAAWARLPYPALCASVLKLFVPPDDADVTHAELESLVASAFARFGSDEVVELKTLPASAGGASGGQRSELHVAELWHGPTLAFKDLGMSVLGAMLSHLLARRRTELTLLVGTSGDTGSSAIEATRGLRGIQIVVLYPLQGFSGVTPVQERQMTSVGEVEANVHVVGVEGTSDDLDVPMEACFRDSAFKRQHKLGSVNSVNVVRLLVQAVHFFFAYLRLSPDAARDDVAVAVPCGAGGHLAAGLLAVQMGLPVRLVAATNANDAMHRLLGAGELRRGEAPTPTVSPSMDIQVPYNVWRLLYVASGGDGASVRGWQRDFDSGALCLPAHIRQWLSARVRSCTVADGETLATVRSVHGRTGYLLDPHTAVGVAAACREPFGPVTTVCLGVAHAVKFTPAVAEALGVDADTALRAIPDLASHRCVAAVAKMARSAARVSAEEALGQPAPRGCAAIFRRGEDWEARLRALLERVRGRGRGQRARL